MGSRQFVPRRPQREHKTRSRRRVILRDICENLIEIGKRAAFVP
jgi:hypothetical protein